jgi:hypothetical protein
MHDVTVLNRASWEKVRRQGERKVEQSIVESSGSYVVTWHPAASYSAAPKIEIRLPGTEHVVIIDPNEPGEDCGIVIVHPSGNVVKVPVFKDQSELMRQAGRTRGGWALAAVFLPIVVSDDPGSNSAERAGNENP